MKNIKKPILILLILTMLFSMVPMVSFAADSITLKATVDKEIVKIGDIVTLSIYIEGVTSVGLATWVMPYDTTAFEYVEGSVTSALGKNTANVMDDVIIMMSMAGGSTANAVQTVQFKAIKDVAEDVVFSFEFDETCTEICNDDGDSYYTTHVGATVTIAPPFIANYVVEPDLEPFSVEIGDSITDKLPRSTVVKDSESGSKSEIASLTWSCDEYESGTIGNYTFIGVIGATDGVANLEALADWSTSVDIQVIPASSFNSTSVWQNGVFEQPQKEDRRTPYTEEELIEYVKKKIGRITVYKNQISDTYAAGTYDVAIKEGEDLSATNMVGHSVTLTITLPETSDNGKFILNGENAKIDINLEIIPRDSGLYGDFVLPNAGEYIVEILSAEIGKNEWEEPYLSLKMGSFDNHAYEAVCAYLVSVNGVKCFQETENDVETLKNMLPINQYVRIEVNGAGKIISFDFLPNEEAYSISEYTVEDAANQEKIYTISTAIEYANAGDFITVVGYLDGVLVQANTLIYNGAKRKRTMMTGVLDTIKVMIWDGGTIAPCCVPESMGI